MAPWLARLAFSFFILAGLLFYQAYREATGPVAPPTWRIALYCLGAGVAVGLGARGLRERHEAPPRHPDDNPRDPDGR